MTTPTQHADAVEALTDELQLAGAERIIWRDFFTLCLAKAGSAGFSNEQSAAFLAIIRATVQHALAKKDTAAEGVVGDSGRGGPLIADNYDCFKTLVLEYGISQHDGSSSTLFTVEDIRVMTAFLSETFYRHYKLHMCVLGGLRRKVRKHGCAVPVETPPTMRPLRLATVVAPQAASDASVADPEPADTPTGQAAETAQPHSAAAVSEALAPVVEHRVFSAMELPRADVQEKRRSRSEHLGALQAKIDALEPV